MFYLFIFILSLWWLRSSEKRRNLFISNDEVEVRIGFEENFFYGKLVTVNMNISCLFLLFMVNHLCIMRYFFFEKQPNTLVLAFVYFQKK